MGTATLPPPPTGVSPALITTTSCPANIRETKICFGFKPQTDLATKNADLDMWSLTKTNPSLSVINPVVESDALDIGKGDEFAANLFPTSIDAGVSIEKYGSSEFFAWLFCFATGSATKTPAGTGGFKYAAVMSDPVLNCINVPPFTYVEQIRPQPDSVIDRAILGMCINDFSFALASGPGRANCRATVNAVGTGAFVNPSGSIIPATYAEHFLNASSAVIQIANIDYVLSKSFISLDFRYSNNIRLASGYYPGSGTQNGYAVRGRMEYGTREIACSFVARASKGSIEANQLITQPITENPFTISVTGAALGVAAHQMKVTAPRTALNSVIIGDADGIVTVNCQITFLKPVSGAMITLEATTSKDAILGL